MLIILYDHSLRNQKMKDTTFNTVEFYKEAVKLLKIQRNFEAYKRKYVSEYKSRIQMAKKQPFTLEEMKSLLRQMQRNIGNAWINDFKLSQTPFGLQFDRKANAGGEQMIRSTYPISRAPQIQREEQPVQQQRNRSPTTPVRAERQQFEQRKQKDETFLRQISERTGVKLPEIRHLWQLCRLDMQLLLDDLKKNYMSEDSQDPGNEEY